MNEELDIIRERGCPYCGSHNIIKTFYQKINKFKCNGCGVHFDAQKN